MQRRRALFATASRSSSRREPCTFDGCSGLVSRFPDELDEPPSAVGGWPIIAHLLGGAGVFLGLIVTLVFSTVSDINHLAGGHLSPLRGVLGLLGALLGVAGVVLALPRRASRSFSWCRQRALLRRFPPLRPHRQPLPPAAPRCSPSSVAPLRTPPPPFPRRPTHRMLGVMYMPAERAGHRDTSAARWTAPLPRDSRQCSACCGVGG